jgi:carbamoyltransferase
MRTLGICAFSRGAGAALVIDGRPVAAMVEERFTRVSGEARYPERAVRACLKRAGLEPGELDQAVFFEKPLRRFERVISCELGAFPRSLKSFPRVLTHWLAEGLWTKNRLSAELGLEPGRLRFASHHAAHAAAAYFASPFDDAAVLVVDGAGEWAASSTWRGRDLALEPLSEIHFPHSLVEAAGAFAAWLAFAPHDAPDVLDDLAAHGRPQRTAELRALLGVQPDGGLALDREAFDFECEAGTGFGEPFTRTFGAPRTPGQPLRLAPGAGSHADFAASVQEALGDALLAQASAARKLTHSSRLCLAGDLAHWPSLVSRLARESGFEQVFVPPAPGDAGSALGAALYVQHVVHGIPRVAGWEHAFLGQELGETQATSSDAPTEAAQPARLVELLAAGRTLGRVRGPVELGPRALGGRCALADPRGRAGRDALARGLRMDEDFRSPALALVEEQAERALELPSAARASARYQHVAARVREDFKERVAGAVRPDGSLRIQLVSRENQGDLHDLLRRFGEASGVAGLLIVPLARRGDPPARSAADALAVFERSRLDALDLDGQLYVR